MGGGMGGVVRGWRRGGGLGVWMGMGCMIVMNSSLGWAVNSAQCMIYVYDV